MHEIATNTKYHRNTKASRNIDISDSPPPACPGLGIKTPESCDRRVGGAQANCRLQTAVLGRVSTTEHEVQNFRTLIFFETRALGRPPDIAARPNGV